MAQAAVPRCSQPYASTPMVWPANFLRLHGLWMDLSSGSSPVTRQLGWRGTFQACIPEIPILDDLPLTRKAQTKTFGSLPQEHHGLGGPCSYVEECPGFAEKIDLSKGSLAACDKQTVSIQWSIHRVVKGDPHARLRL